MQYRTAFIQPKIWIKRNGKKCKDMRLKRQTKKEKFKESIRNNTDGEGIHTWSAIRKMNQSPYFLQMSSLTWSSN